MCKLLTPISTSRLENITGKLDSANGPQIRLGKAISKRRLLKAAGKNSGSYKVGGTKSGSRDAGLSKTAPNTGRGWGFWTIKLDVLDAIEENLRIGTDEWNHVSVLHAEKYLEMEGTAESIRRKFNTLTCGIYLVYP